MVFFDHDTMTIDEVSFGYEQISKNLKNVKNLIKWADANKKVTKIEKNAKLFAEKQAELKRKREAWEQKIKEIKVSCIRMFSVMKCLQKN